MAVRIRDVGYSPGIHSPGPSNSILDVPGVHVSQVTLPTSNILQNDSNACKGVTIISPRPPKDFYKPCRAGTFTFNGNGEMTGGRQMADWGFCNVPIGLTNSTSLGTVYDGIWDWVLDQQDRLGWDALTRSRLYGTPVVAETADWQINCELRHARLPAEAVTRCFAGLKAREDGGEVREGQFGGGAGMTTHMFAGGTGTASRIIDGRGGDGFQPRAYTLGVLVQSNYGHLVDLTIGGVPVGKILHKEKSSAGQAEEYADVHAPPTVPTERELAGRTQDGSIVIVIITDAPLSTSQLQRLARHATTGLARVGSYGIGRNFSGDIFLALSTAEHGPEQLDDGARPRHQNPSQVFAVDMLKNESIDTYFYAAAEAVEEAILNCMVGGREGKVAMDGSRVDGFPVDRVRQILEQHLVKI